MNEIRDFQETDPALISNSHTWLKLFSQYQPDFGAFDPGLNDAFALAWGTQIESCENHPRDEAMVDLQQGETQKLETAMKAALKGADELQYYVQRAWPDEPRMLEEFFGRAQRSKVRTDALRLGVWLQTAKTIADDYPAELAAVGMPATLPADLQNLAFGLLQAEVAQERAKRLRNRAARIRIALHNALFAFVAQVRKAADVIYFDSDTKRGLWR